MYRYYSRDQFYTKDKLWEMAATRVNFLINLKEALKNPKLKYFKGNKTRLTSSDNKVDLFLRLFLQFATS